MTIASNSAPRARHPRQAVVPGLTFACRNRAISHRAQGITGENDVEDRILTNPTEATRATTTSGGSP